ncbi:MAG: dethiobiotin synthase [Sediminibacterium sp.]
MQKPIFITGTGTDVGKTLAAAIVTEALEADYWKPVQAGFDDGTDTLLVASLLTNGNSVLHKELYKLKLPASPHIAAGREGIRIDLAAIAGEALAIRGRMKNKRLVIEGAGGLLVPLNEKETVADLIKALDARVILVSRNYLGSINHSLLTAAYCRDHQIDVAGWIFNDHYMQYESEIAGWSGYPSLGTIPKLSSIDKKTIHALALQMNPLLNATI